MWKGLIVGVVLVLGSPTGAWASLAFSPEGRVVSTGPYTGPPFTHQDAVVFLGTGVMMQFVYSFLSSTTGLGLAAVSAITWGAWRTNKYRPESIAMGIRARIDRRKARQLPGAVPFVPAAEKQEVWVR